MEEAPFIAFRRPRVDVYELALELVGQVHDIIADAESTRFYLKDRLDRNATQIAMALGHVAEEMPSERWRGYRKTLRIVTDCGTLLEVMARQGCLAIGALARARETVAKLQAEIVPLALWRN